MTASSEYLSGKKVGGKATTHVAHRNSIAGLECYIQQVGRRHTHQSMLFLLWCSLTCQNVQMPLANPMPVLSVGVYGDWSFQKAVHGDLLLLEVPPVFLINKDQV
jgi:hypothetical protein